MTRDAIDAALSAFNAPVGTPGYRAGMERAIAAYEAFGEPETGERDGHEHFFHPGEDQCRCGLGRDEVSEELERPASVHGASVGDQSPAAEPLQDGGEREHQRLIEIIVSGLSRDEFDAMVTDMAELVTENWPTTGAAVAGQYSLARHPHQDVERRELAAMVQSISAKVLPYQPSLSSKLGPGPAIDNLIAYWEAGHQDVEPPTARNGEACDCETPGDWHRVANDFQRAMFTERARAEAAEQEVERLRDEVAKVEQALAVHDEACWNAGAVSLGLRLCRAALAEQTDEGAS
jgi:hypothetical protein